MERYDGDTIGHRHRWIQQRTSFGPAKYLAHSSQSGQGKVNGPYNTKPNLSSPSNKTMTSHLSTDNRNPNVHNRLKPLFRKLTAAEIAKWKTDRLCFRCDEKWHARHKCPNKELFLLVVQEDGSEREWDEELEEEAEEFIPGVTEMVELSLNSLVGISSPRTMKLRGTIRTEALVVMIDSGATNNFISEKVMHHLGLPLVRTKGYGVLTGTGVTVQDT